MSRRSQRILQSLPQDKSYSRQKPTILNLKRKADQIDMDVNTAYEQSEATMSKMSSFEYSPSSSHDDYEESADETTDEATEMPTTHLRWRSFQKLMRLPVPRCTRRSPLPQLSWADPEDVWKLMVKKDKLYTRDYHMLSRHPGLQARMRAILLDWLTEVCEVYKLHKDTYYLAIDFVDRFLSLHENIPKQQLQLIGITALFLASKVEEIYPPKLTEFAFVTDSACTEDEIVCQELIMLKGLNWDLAPITANGWLNIYLQLSSVHTMTEAEHTFVFPQYSADRFTEVASVVDLCLLDISSLQFPYSQIAAAALFHVISDSLALTVSGYTRTELEPCVQWMSAFATTIREIGRIPSKFLQQIAVEDMHNIQTHVVDLQMLEKAQSRLHQAMCSSRESPEGALPGVLTPPPSDGKGRTSRNDISQED